MTAEQKLKWAILALAASWADQTLTSVTAENVDALYDALVAEGGHWDAMNEVRSTGCRTELSRSVCIRTTRHYEHYEVASPMPDGSWVGWTYWFGGGKFGEASAVEWMSLAYDVNHRAELKTISVNVFTLPDPDLHS